MVDRLTVGEVDSLADGAIPRGPGLPAAALAPITRQQLALLDRHVDVCAGDILIDGEPVTKLSAVLGGQTSTINALFEVLVEAQGLTPDEREQLTIAVRFQLWLAFEQRNNKSTSKWVETGTSCAKCHELELCGRRACGATPAKKPVWHDKKIHVRRCPVLSITPETDRILRLFEWTHVAQPTGFHQSFLPASAQLEDQEAWTLSALSHVRAVYTDVHHERVRHDG